MAEILLSLGANLGNREETLSKAIELLKQRVFTGKIKISSVYETEPVGFKNQPWFFNLAIYGLTELTPQTLLEKCKSIEFELGRIVREHWHEREIDIDIILFGQEIINTPDLIIPHQRLHERKFVLLPCSEIAGNIIHPLLEQTIYELLGFCKDNSYTIHYTNYENEKY